MRIIDANSGHDVQVGVPFENVNGTVRVHEVKAGLFSAQGLVETNGPHGHMTRWVPLTVRYFHPAFPLQKVAFLPS